MIRTPVITVAAMLLLGLGCKSPGSHSHVMSIQADTPAVGIDAALRLARAAVASDCAVERYAVDGCVRQADGWLISFAPRSVDEVGTEWSRSQKERWIARGNHYDVYVYDDGSTRVIGGE